MIRAYKLPHQSGRGIVLIAWVLNKIQTRKILFNSEVVGDAGGAGLRNYWANSVYSIIKDKKLKKVVVPVF